MQQEKSKKEFKASHGTIWPIPQVLKALAKVLDPDEIKPAATEEQIEDKKGCWTSLPAKVREFFPADRRHQCIHRRNR